MSLRRSIAFALLFALAADAPRLFAETLRASDIMGPTNANWMALARAQMRIREGEPLDFVWSAPPDISYAEIRRDLWLAALHGITAQTGPDERTRRLMAPEMEVVRLRLRVPFARDIAVRDVPGADRILPALVRAQSPCLLIGEKGTCDIPTTLRCQGDEVLGERTGIVFPSFRMAVSFTQAFHTDNGLVFESDGRVATEIFVRRFQDGSATVVNMTKAMRLELVYRRGLATTTFDLPPDGVVHLLQGEPARLAHSVGESFSSGLWKISFETNITPRLVRAALLSTVVQETYRGEIRYETTILTPPGEEALFLHLDTAGSEAEVEVNGQSLGIRAWPPFDWLIPGGGHGKSQTLVIRIKKRTLGGFLQAAPEWRRL